LENLLNRSTKRISSIVNTLQDKRYIHIKPRNNKDERRLFPLITIQKCDGVFKGVFIPINVLSDNNLNDKEKFIFSIALYYSNVCKNCTLNNENLKEILGVTKNQISRIVNNLRRKGYTINEYIYINNHKEILYRKIKPIRKNDDTFCKKALYRYRQKVQQDMVENVNVLKSKNKNYKKYNGFHNYEGRKYPKEFFDGLYANL